MRGSRGEHEGMHAQGAVRAAPCSCTHHQHSCMKRCCQFTICLFAAAAWVRQARPPCVPGQAVLVGLPSPVWRRPAELSGVRTGLGHWGDDLHHAAAACRAHSTQDSTQHTAQAMQRVFGRCSHVHTIRPETAAVWCDLAQLVQHYCCDDDAYLDEAFLLGPMWASHGVLTRTCQCP